jgi:hypothetical protein
VGEQLFLEDFTKYLYLLLLKYFKVVRGQLRQVVKDGRGQGASQGIVPLRGSQVASVRRRRNHGRRVQVRKKVPAS